MKDIKMSITDRLLCSVLIICGALSVPEYFMKNSFLFLSTLVLSLIVVVVFLLKIWKK